MKKTVVFLYLYLLLCLAALGQQDPQYTNYMFYKLSVNPGYAGSEDAINGLLLNRYQWVGYEGAPKTLVLSADMPIKTFNRPSGIGINIISDQLGFYKNMWININYSYKITTKFGTLSIGISPGIYNFDINPGGWETGDDSQGESGDNLIPEQDASQLAFDIGMGAYLYSNKYYLGFSVSHINQASVVYDDNGAGDYLTRHYYLTGGYNIKLPDPLFELQPSFLFKSDLAAWQLDLNANIVYDNRFWGGLTYRVQDAIAILLGTELLSGLRIGYSFDLTTSKIRSGTYGSHEFFVNYAFSFGRKRNQKYKSIRFL